MDAYDYGSYQHRKRAILIGTTKAFVRLVPPKLIEVKTVRKALEGLKDSIPNQLDYTVPKKETEEKF